MWQPPSGVAEDRNRDLGLTGAEAMGWQPPSGVAEDRNLPCAVQLLDPIEWQPPSGVAEDRNYIDGYAYTAAVLDYDKMYRPLAEASTIPSSE